MTLDELRLRIEAASLGAVLTRIAQSNPHFEHVQVEFPSHFDLMAPHFNTDFCAGTDPT